jgi:ATP-binding cassette subfamily F protein 3
VFETVKSAASDRPDLEIRTILGGFGFSGEAVEKRVEVLSGGEKIRLAFARLLVSPPNFLVLDEPTTHLDIQAREALETALIDYQGTICMVSHDIEFVRRVATGVMAMTPPGVTRYPGGYDYYHEKIAGPRPETVNRKPDVERGSNERVGQANDNGQTTNDRPDSKARRRQRAIERQALHDRTKDMKKAIRQAEQEVERLETERASLSAEIAAPTGATDFASLSRRLKQIQYEIDIATGHWEEAVAAIENAHPGAGRSEPA